MQQTRDRDSDDLRKQMGSLLSLVTGVQDLLALGPLSSRLISRASLSELFIASIGIHSAASVTAVFLTYAIVRGRDNQLAMFSISGLAVVVFVAELAMGIFCLIFFNQVSDRAGVSKRSKGLTRTAFPDLVLSAASSLLLLRLEFLTHSPSLFSSSFHFSPASHFLSALILVL